MTRSLSPAEMTKPLLDGATVFAARNTAVGTVEDVIGEGRSAVLKIRLGGLVGFGGKLVALPADELQFAREDNGVIAVHTDRDPAELERMPPMGKLGRE